MDISTVKIVRTALTMGTLVFALLGKLVLKSAPILGFVLVMVAMALLVGDLIFSVLFWKCPCCGRHLRYRSLWPKYCGCCGEYLG